MKSFLVPVVHQPCVQLHGCFVELILSWSSWTYGEIFGCAWYSCRNVVHVCWPMTFLWSWYHVPCGKQWLSRAVCLKFVSWKTNQAWHAWHMWDRHSPMGVLMALEGKTGEAIGKIASKAVDLYDRCVGSEWGCVQCTLCYYLFSSTCYLLLGMSLTIA